MLDMGTYVRYYIVKLANLTIEGPMDIKSISSTQAQNNFGRVLDDITHNKIRYIIERRGMPQAIVISFDDFTHLLGNESEREEMGGILKEVRPMYSLGKILTSAVETE